MVDGPQRRVSMADVAAEAGVSGQTVSRVANGSPRVDPATRARVEATMERLGYRMHRAARIKPVVIDESLVDFESLLLSRELGYSGVALKACKGHGEALLMGAAAQQREEQDSNVECERDAAEVRERGPLAVFGLAERRRCGRRSGGRGRSVSHGVNCLSSERTVHMDTRGGA